MTVIIASTSVSNKTTDSQERLEAIFHTVDTIKSDLNKCGMRLQEAKQLNTITPFCQRCRILHLHLRPCRRAATGDRGKRAA